MVAILRPIAPPSRRHAFCPRCSLPVKLIFECEGQWVLWSPRGSKGKRQVCGHWDQWQDAIRAAIEQAGRIVPGAELVIFPVPGKDLNRTLQFPPPR